MSGQNGEQSSPVSTRSFIDWLRILLHSCEFLDLIVCFGFHNNCVILQIYHVQKLFESNYKFSHLSNLERELSLSSKEAFYYSFYKRIIDADTFEAGIERLMNDNLTEFNENTSINSLQKFHILPEVLIGCLYKNFIALTQRFKLPTVVCFTVERDDPKLEHEILSCEGYGEPIYFYLSVVWTLSGITVFLLYMYGYFLHRNLIAGCVVIVYYFCMHESATNIHRQPMSRQNFALPFIIWQTFYLNLYIDKHHFVRRSSGIHPRNYAMVTLVDYSISDIFTQLLIISRFSI